MNIIKTAAEIIANILNAKGQFVTAKWQSVVSTSAAFKHLKITKITSAVVRSGIDFSKLSSVKASIANGDRSEVKPLSWGSWKQFPYVIEHTKKSGEYNEYVRLYPSLSANHIPKVSYFVDGIETPKAKILAFVTNSKAKDMTNGIAPECFTLTSTNILDIVELT